MNRKLTLKKLIYRAALGAALWLMVPAAALAQDDDGVVVGTIFDAESDASVPGVNVVLVGTEYGTASGADGRYEIRGVPAGTYTLQASYVGYQTAEQEIEVEAGQTLTQDLSLEPATRELQEMVVQGYRIEQTEQVTGAVAQVEGEIIENDASENFGDAVQGRMAGVRVTSLSGAPGGELNFNIRGSASINAGSDPLYIVDGVQIDDDSEAAGDIRFSVSPLSNINPEDIESIRVLKDVAATSIYGAQAANGVVIINTKGGRDGEAQVSFSAQAGAATNAGDIEVLDARGYAEYQTRGYLNTYVPYLQSLYGITEEAAREAALDGEYFLDGARTLYGDPETAQTTDWQDAVFRTGVTQTYNLSVRGGSDNVSYYVSGGYTDTEGQVIGSSYSRATLRTNLDFDLSENLEAEARINLSNISQDGVISGDIFVTSPLYGSLLIRPDRQIYNERGNPASGYNFSFSGDTFGYNLVAEEELTTDDFSSTQIQGSLALNYQVGAGLFTRTLAGLKSVDVQEEFYNSPQIPQNAGTLGSGSVAGDRTLDYNVSQTLNYNGLYADQHALSTILGAELKHQGANEFLLGGEGFPNARLQNLANAAQAVDANYSTTAYRVLSVFSEAEYTFDERYVISGTIRTDGSSRFGEDNRFGIFGSGSVAWQVDNEAFMEGVDFVDRLKLRASAGVTGNSQIGNFASRFLFSGGGEYVGPAGGDLRSGIRPSQLGNPGLTWERSKQYSLGVDYGLFGERLVGSVNLYRNDSADLLLFRPLPVNTGFSARLENVGAIRSEGLEVELSTVTLDAGGFRWDTNFNISFQRSEVLELVDGQSAIDFGSVRYEVGEPIAQWYLPEYAGVNPDDGRPFFYDENGDLTYLALDADRKLLGNGQPDFFGGLGNTFSYGGLSLEVFFQFDYGRVARWSDGLALDLPFSFNKRQEVADEAWSQPGDVTEHPRPYYFGINFEQPVPQNGAFFYSSGRWLEDASYIRLKRVRLGYQLPEGFIGAAGLRSARLFVQGRNLLTFTNYPGFDPETTGFDAGRYPQSQELTAGINIGL